MKKISFDPSFKVITMTAINEELDSPFNSFSPLLLTVKLFAFEFKRVRTSTWMMNAEDAY